MPYPIYLLPDGSLRRLSPEDARKIKGARQVDDKAAPVRPNKARTPANKGA